MPKLKAKRFEDPNNSSMRSNLFAETFNNTAIIENARVLEDSDWEIFKVPVEQLTPYDKNIRLSMTAIDKLARNIYSIGLMEPIIIYKNPDQEDNYIIIAGHRRVEAYKLNAQKYPDQKWDKIPCKLMPSEISDDTDKVYEMWQSSNFHSRHMSEEEILSNIDFYMRNIDNIDSEDKCAIIFELRNEKLIEELKQDEATFEVKYDELFEEFKKKYPTLKGKQKSFDKVEYIRSQLKEAEINISTSTIRKHISIMDNAIPKLKEAYIKKEIPVRIAYEICTKKNQLQLLNAYFKDINEYKKLIEQNKELVDEKKNKFKNFFKPVAKKLDLYISKGEIKPLEYEMIEKELENLKKKLDTLQSLIKE